MFSRRDRIMEILNETNWKIDPSWIEKILNFVFEKEGKKGEVSVALVSREKIRDLNREFRGKDYPTDVLSFPYGDEMVGEIVICPDVVKENAEQYGNTFEDEMLLTLVHAALHLCGYDHEMSTENAEEMFKKQDEYVKEVKKLL
jgi:probable rRNA maturation factor